MKVEPLPFEPERFLVQSQSRKGIVHLVDMNYDPEQRKPVKGRPVCGCEDCQIRNRTCKHILAVYEATKTTP
jgi:SWIM zinc finger.